MEPCPELKDHMLRYYEAVTRGDRAFLDQFLSQHGNVLLIGTDPTEWWATPATIRQSLTAQAQAGIRIIAGDPQAYREGTVAWVADRARLHLPNGTEVPWRWTGVFHQEEGGWKLVQGHGSVGIPNADLGSRR